METNQPNVQVETSGTFERQFRSLFKRYRKIRSDVLNPINRLSQLQRLRKLLRHLSDNKNNPTLKISELYLVS